MGETQEQNVRFTARNVDVWSMDYCRRYKEYCKNPILKRQVARYAKELKYIASHWEAARNFGDYGRTIREFEQPTIDPKNAPSRIDLMDRLFIMMYNKSLKSLQAEFRI